MDEVKELEDCINTLVATANEWSNTCKCKCMICRVLLKKLKKFVQVVTIISEDKEKQDANTVKEDE